MTAKKPEKVKVKMLIDQQSPDFGEKTKGEEFEMNPGLAKILSGRKIVKIIKGGKDGGK